MKTYEKRITGLGFVLCLLFLISLWPSKASAIGFTPQDIRSATYKFQDGANISAKFDFNGTPVIFTDKDITDSTRNYVPQDTGVFCDPGTVSDQNGIKGNLRYGINISTSANLTQAAIPAQIKLAYLAGTNCNKQNAVLVNISVTSPNKEAATDYQWDQNVIRSLNGAEDSITLKLIPNTDSLIYTDFGGKCSGVGTIIALDAPKGNSGRLYKVIDISKTNIAKRNLGQYPTIARYFSEIDCHVESGPKLVTIIGKTGVSATTASPANGEVDGSCEANAGGFSFTWAMCPLLYAANSAVNGTDGKGGLLGLYQDQLSFTVSKDIGVKGSNTSSQVQTTWSLIKNISTAAIIIIMLIMIFSQAISIGPFDAYTIRKLLPRLVAAVILMQLSWYLVAWGVDLVDSIGRSLADLLYAPFGGAEQLDLFHLLERAHIGTGEAAALNFAAIVGVIVLGVAALPVVLMMAFAVVAAVVTALVVLIFRKIIIIFCLILAPLAIAAWILPGTQRYFRLWFDNLVKVLLMFPLIVGIIAAGHIFAYIAATQDNTELLNLIFILVGVFGVLFILPKTFKWGGSMMAAGGSFITSATNRYSGRDSALGKGIQGYGERIQGKGADKLEYNRKGTRANLVRGLRRVQSGHMLPTKRSRALALQTGTKYAQEERDLATIYANNVYNKALTEGYTDQKNEPFEPGVEAGKIALGELTRHKDHRIGEEAVKKFVATQSWPELQSMVDSDERHIFDDNPNWVNAAAKDPDTYRAVLRSRTDAAAHIVQGVDQKYDGVKFETKEEEVHVKSAHRIFTAIAKQLSNEDFSGESDGFWAEVADRATITEDMSEREKELAKAIQGTLQNRFYNINRLGGNAPQQLLGHLANGGVLQENVKRALGGEIAVTEYIRPTSPDRSPPPPPEPPEEPLAKPPKPSQPPPREPRASGAPPQQTPPPPPQQQP